MPVHQFVHDRELVAPGAAQLLGPSVDRLFRAPQRLFESSGDRAGHVDGFKAMVMSLHTAGLEVILDAVFNHTAEGNERGPTLCFHGLENGAYYLLAEDRRRYVDATGTATRSTRTSLLVRNESAAP